MKIKVLTLLSLLVLAACNSEEREARRRQEQLDRIFTTTAFNYTPHVLHSIHFKESALPFKIDDAPSGGSTYMRNGSGQKLDNGEPVQVSSRDCCFMWSGPLDKPGRIKIVWLVIHNLSYYNGAAEEYDERRSRENPPGARWCQATVDIKPAAGPERSKMVFLHFLPDGSVQAELGSYRTEKPLPSEQVKLHSASLPEGQLCKQEIENPWYGIPRKPHRE